MPKKTIQQTLDGELRERKTWLAGVSDDMLGRTGKMTDTEYARKWHAFWDEVYRLASIPD